MSSGEFIKESAAAELPQQWDEVATCIFQKADFLSYTETYNPCKQRYYLYWNKNVLRAAACVYTLGVDLFTFKKIPSRVPMQIIGLPASVSAPGIFGRTREDEEALIQYLLKAERGLILCLNLDVEIDPKPAIGMTMLPTVQIDLPFDSWNDYIGSLRSHYRRRTRHILEGFNGVQKLTSACSAFTSKHHGLYLQILSRTSNKLEILTEDFFRNLPEHFRLTSFYYENDLLCWHINCTEHNRLYFFFGGHDYTLLEKHQSYFNNLLGIIREGIEGGYHCIDLGQTAEIPKMKAGGRVVAKNLFVYSRNAILLFLLKIGKPLLAYRPVAANYHTLKTPSHPAKKKIHFV